MAMSSSCLANVTALVMSVAVVLLALSVQTTNAQEDPIVSFTWTPDGCAQFNAAAAANADTPIPLGSSMEFINTGVHRVVRISEADYNAGKVDNPIFVLGQNEYGVTVITVDEPGMYHLVSDYPGDFALGYQISFQVGIGDCPKVNQG